MGECELRGGKSCGAIAKQLLKCAGGASVRLAAGEFEAALEWAACEGTIADCRVPSADCRVPIAECQWSMTDCRLPMAECRLPIADCRWPMADGR